MTTEVTGDAIRFVYCFEHAPELPALRDDLDSLVPLVSHSEVIVRQLRDVRRLRELELPYSPLAELCQEHPERIEDLYPVVHGIGDHHVAVTCCDDTAREIKVPVPAPPHAYVKQQPLGSVSIDTM